MIALGNLLIAVAGVLRILISFFYFLVIARCILSFVSPDPRNPIVEFITTSTEPILGWVRQWIRPIGMLDISPIFVIMVLFFLEHFLVNSLEGYGRRMLLSASMPLVAPIDTGAPSGSGGTVF